MALIRGKAYWAKIVGKPTPGYDKSKLEWSFDLSIDDETRKQLIKEGVGDRIKNKGDERGDFITFKRPAKRQDGTDSKPIKVVDHHGNAWDRRLIGNGSTLNVKFLINEYNAGPRVIRKPAVLAVQVWDYVEYEGKNNNNFEDDFPVKDSGVEDWSEA